LIGPQSAETQLEGLIEIVPPQPVSYWPETIGWFFLLALIALAAAWFIFRRHRCRKANEYRRWALTELVELAQTMEDEKSIGRALAELPVLVKRTALHCFSREKIASLSGEKWLAFLDSSYKGTGFAQGPGRLLEEVAYKPADQLGHYAQDNIRPLINLIRTWIKTHRRET
jgi:hypothetical protein